MVMLAARKHVIAGRFDLVAHLGHAAYDYRQQLPGVQMPDLNITAIVEEFVSQVTAAVESEGRA